MTARQLLAERFRVYVRGGPKPFMVVWAAGTYAERKLLEEVAAAAGRGKVRKTTKYRWRPWLWRVTRMAAREALSALLDAGMLQESARAQVTAALLEVRRLKKEWAYPAGPKGAPQDGKVALAIHWCRLAEAAEISGLHRRMISRLAKAGAVETMTRGGNRRKLYSVADLTKLKKEAKDG